tara:strand:- start:11 stop:298 length:288 start_codon:yes stop_codon:yes gene_type:complete
MSKITEQCICLHKSKHLYDDKGKFDGSEYCEKESDADIVAVFLQQHYENQDTFDVLEEKDFELEDYKTFDAAYKAAENYVDELQKKYSNAGYDEY